MKQEYGFSLVETMIAMVLISILMLAIPTLPGLARLTQELSASSAVAENIAENTLELYRNIQYNTIVDIVLPSVTVNTYGTNRIYTPTVTVTGYTLGAYDPGVNIYSGAILTSGVPSSHPQFNNSDIKIVTVTLSYQVQGQTVQVVRNGIYRPD